MHTAEETARDGEVEKEKLADVLRMKYKVTVPTWLLHLIDITSAIG